MEELKQIESSNINFKWLDNIYEQLHNIQDMERLALEGCNSLMEYLQVPFNMRMVLLPEVQYKNLRFMCREIDILIDNLAPILKDKTSDYSTKMKTVVFNLNARELFLVDMTKNGQVVQTNTTKFFNQTLQYVIEIKSSLIKDIGHLLYVETDEKRKSW